MARTIIAAEIGYISDTTTSPITTGTAYIASEGFVTLHTDALADTFFAGRIDGDLNYSVQLSTAFWGGNSSIGIGEIEVINDDGQNDDWIDYDWRDQAIVLKQHTFGASGASYDDATVILNAIVERMDVVSEKRLRFVIRDPAAELIKPMTTDSYDDTTDASGVLKPIAFGQPELCGPVLVDESTLAYDCDDTGIQAVIAVYDQGVSVDYVQSSTGFFLVTNPAGKITATVATSAAGNDPFLEPSPTEYTISGEGRTLQALTGGFSEVFLGIDHLRDSASGGKYYFEMYIDDMYKETVAGFTNMQLAIGIQSASGSPLVVDAVNPQQPGVAGLYCLQTGTRYVGGLHIEFELWDGDGGTSPASSAGVGRMTDTLNGGVGTTVGVKVDFDSMTIEFLWKNAGFSGTESDISPVAGTFGPLGISAGTYSPVIGASDNYDHQSNYGKGTISLIETDFVYALPSGYAAWSEGLVADSTFANFTSSITSRLGVTFDSTSVTTIDALTHSAPPVKYTYSYYLDKSTTAATVLGWACASIGAAWWVNRLGNIEFVQLQAPGTSVRTIDDTQIIGDITIAPDYAKNLSNGIGALKNWSPYRASEVAGSATEKWKQEISRDYQFEYRSSNVLASGYAHADGAELK